MDDIQLFINAAAIGEDVFFDGDTYIPINSYLSIISINFIFVIFYIYKFCLYFYTSLL